MDIFILSYLITSVDVTLDCMFWLALPLSTAHLQARNGPGSNEDDVKHLIEFALAMPTCRACRDVLDQCELRSRSLHDADDDGGRGGVGLESSDSALWTGHPVQVTDAMGSRSHRWLKRNGNHPSWQQANGLQL